MISHITPTTPEEMDSFYPVFKYFWNFIEHDRPEESIFKQHLYSLIPGCTLVYYNDIPLACFLVEELGKDSAELHGMLRPDYASLVPNAVAVINELQAQILQWLYFSLEKRKVVLKAHPDNKGARGFALKWGARKLPNKDLGRNVYVLPLERFLERAPLLVK